MLLSVNNIHKNYRNDKGNIARHVLNGIDLTMEKGDKIAIVGPSGSGKTTLLNLIGSIDTPDEGSVLFKERNITTLDPKGKQVYRNQEVGFIFQMHHLLPQCTVLENVLVPSLVVPDKNGEHEKRAEELIRKVGLWDLRDQKPGELSGGECQRVAVIRALINRPDLLLADEPTGALDEKNAENLMQLLIDLNNSYQTSLILVTHAMEIAGKMNKVYRLREGTLQSGDPATGKSNPEKKA